MTVENHEPGTSNREPGTGNRLVSANPLLDGLRIEPAPGPTTLVIFGASGDLTKRKLLPALLHLSRGQRLPARFSVIGVGRTDLGDDVFRGQFEASLREFAGVREHDDVTRSLIERAYYVGGALTDPAVYQRLADRVRGLEAEGVLFYLSIPPSGYAGVIEQLGAARLNVPAGGRGWRRVIIEKPFGTDLATARELNDVVHRHFTE